MICLVFQGLSDVCKSFEKRNSKKREKKKECSDATTHLTLTPPGITSRGKVIKRVSKGKRITKPKGSETGKTSSDTVDSLDVPPSKKRRKSSSGASVASAPVNPALVSPHTDTSRKKNYDVVSSSLDIVVDEKTSAELSHKVKHPTTEPMDLSNYLPAKF